MSKFKNFFCLGLCLNSVVQADQEMKVVSVNNLPELKSSTMSSLGWSAFNAVISFGGQKGLQKLGYDINPFWIFCGLELFKQIALSTATNRANQEIVNKNNSDLQNRLNSANRQAEQLQQQLGEANEAKNQAEQLQKELNEAKENAEKQLGEANGKAEQLQQKQLDIQEDSEFTFDTSNDGNVLLNELMTSGIQNNE